MLGRIDPRVAELLLKRYGSEPHYAPAHVRTTLEVAKLDTRYLTQVCAMYGDRNEFIAWMLEQQDAKRDAFVVRSGNQPYRSVAERPSSAVAQTAQDFGVLYDELRAEAARILGTRKFLSGPRSASDGWSPIANDGAVGTKVPPGWP